MMNNRHLQVCHSVWALVLVLSGLPKLADANSQSDSERKQLNQDAGARFTDALLHVDKRAPYERLAQDGSLSPEERACWQLAEDRMNRQVSEEARADKQDPPPPWYPFAGRKQEPAPMQEWLTLCYELPGRYGTDMKAVLEDSCKGLQQTPICQQWLKRFDGQGKLPLPRKVSAGLSIGLGVTSIVLGVLHLSFPLFKTGGDDCSANGLRVPCIAGRYELGGALIGVGVVIGAVGGGLSLGLPHD